MTPYSLFGKLPQRYVVIQIVSVVVWCCYVWATLPAFGQSGSRVDPLTQFNTQGLTLPVHQILSGGPPKDGIPALTLPKTEPVSDARFDDDQRMVVVTVGMKTRAYPINVLSWHEVLNDTLKDTPIAVIYCPLCDSVSVIDRRIKSGDEIKVLEFGISGLLYNSNVLLYDRNDNALWSQIGLEAISGPHVGKSLKHLPWQITNFASLKKTHPNASVATTDTGYRRDYSRNPYADYFATDRLMFPINSQDNRLKSKTPVIGVRLGEHTRAYPLGAVRDAENGTLVDEIDGQTIVLKADEYGGIAVIESPAKAQVVHTFWFAWSAFHPKTSLYSHTSDEQ